MSIKIGCCTGIFKTEEGKIGIKDIQTIKEAGYDYVELPICAIAALEANEFEEVLEEIEKAGIPCEAGNVMFPGGFKLTGETVDYDEVDEYCRKAFGRMKEIGAKVLVFGSGGARKVDEGFSKEKAFDQLAYLLIRISPVARMYGIDIVVEPLNKTETNIINTVLEGIALVKAVDCENVVLLADYYHMEVENEDMGDIIKAIGDSDILRHTHIANPEGRVFPTEQEDYSQFFNMLKVLGYKGRLSVEGSAKEIASDAICAFKVLSEKAVML